jgi:hypothetical protein
MSESKLSMGLGLTAVVVSVLAIYGWIVNIAEIVHAVHGPVTSMFIGRIVGIFFFPLGAVLGYF